MKSHPTAAFSFPHRLDRALCGRSTFSIAAVQPNPIFCELGFHKAEVDKLTLPANKETVKNVGCIANTGGSSYGIRDDKAIVDAFSYDHNLKIVWCPYNLMSYALI